MRGFFLIAFLLCTVPVFGAAPTQTVTNSMGWTDNQGAGPNAELGFNIERCTGANCVNFLKVNSVGPNVVKYAESIAGDLGGIVYRYQVKAYNSVGQSAPTNILILTSPFIAVVPGAPNGLLGTVVGVTVP